MHRHQLHRYTTRMLGVAALLALGSSAARADVRCGAQLQNDPCMEQNPVCPAAPQPLGLAAGSWPVYQHDAQHTGTTTELGPTCGSELWSRKLKGKVLSPLALAEPAPGQSEVLFVPAAKYPVCALDPDTGQELWCGTNELGKLVDRSSPAIGNGSMLYVGTRDNDLWAIDIPPASSSQGTVAWRQKVCTDGDITTPPLIGPDGLVYMGSDSLGGGTLVAMCPGPARQVKWCHNPIGGGVRNMSPALSPAGDKLYVVIAKSALAAYQPQTGQELWRIELEPRRGRVQRTPNYSPVVDPVTGRVFVGLDSGVWAVDTELDPVTNQERPVATLFHATSPAREKMLAPPALDRARDRLVFIAARGAQASLYAVGLDGTLQWKRSLPRGKPRNNPPVVDGAGRIYVTARKALLGLTPTGDTMWQVESRAPLASSPIIAGGRLYIGSANATVLAIGGCAP
jgi:outer membrane protein assembly factor BamB